ncbi:DUF4224 domain-containing protein [Oxalobacteraceae bacterium OM1]|nr:DUF4224 domain-containing protein [Oxalobacteraceae bacterium OM1]
MFLTRDELMALTAQVQHSAQRKVLNMMGIEHRTRPDGSIVVLRTHVEQMFGCMPVARINNSSEPNWGVLNASCPKT